MRAEKELVQGTSRASEQQSEGSCLRGLWQGYPEITRKAKTQGGETMEPGERTTGTRDEHYNLVSVLYHALHGAENCDIYALDAEAGGRLDLSDFFREAQAMQRHLADEAKELLGIGGAVPGAGDVPAGSAVVDSDAPPEAEPMDV